MTIPMYSGEIPYVTTEQMIEVDRAMMEDYRIELIQMMENAGDVPSGVDTTTGTIFDPAIKATATMMLALPKAGLRFPGLETQVGELHLADISVPPSLYVEPTLALQVGPFFAQSEILRLR